MNEQYYYYKDKEHDDYYIALYIRHEDKHVTKGTFLTHDDIKSVPFFIYLDEKTACNLIMGLTYNYYTIIEAPYRKPGEIDKIKMEKKFYFMNKVNENISKLEQDKILEEEKKLMDIYHEKSDIYFSLKEEQTELLKKAMESISEEDKRKFVLSDEETPQLGILKTIYEARKNPTKRKEMSELNHKLIDSNTYFKEYSSLFSPISNASLDYFKSASNLNDLFKKEFDLFSDEYMKKM